MIAGSPLVCHTIAAFAAVPLVAHTLVVVAPGDGFLAEMSPGRTGSWSVADCGGASRAATVANGLAALHAAGAADDDWVLVHDAARCLVTADLIERLIHACRGDLVGALLAHPVTDTLKCGRDGRVVGTPDRNAHWTAQTPQMFRCAMLREALASAGDAVTDESSAMEFLGHFPLLVPGSASNFKVTFAQDVVLAQTILLERARSTGKELDYDYP
jgi:2-C-methyl-D-erythritol 4-phosphate cytidylyltransferase